MLTLDKEFPVDVPTPNVGEIKVFCDATDNIVKFKDETDTLFPLNIGAAAALVTTGLPVGLALGPAPTGADFSVTTDSATQASFKSRAKVGLMKLTPVVVGPATYNASPGEFVRVDVTAGAVTVLLPPVAGLIDQQIWVKLTGPATFSCTVFPDGSDMIDTFASIILNSDREDRKLYADGASTWLEHG